MTASVFDILEMSGGSPNIQTSLSIQFLNSENFAAPVSKIRKEVRRSVLLWSDRLRSEEERVAVVTLRKSVVSLGRGNRLGGHQRSPCGTMFFLRHDLDFC